MATRTNLGKASRALGAALGGLALSSPQAAPMIDQSYLVPATEFRGGYQVNNAFGPQAAAQSLTVGIDGILTRVDLQVGGNAAYPMTLEIGFGSNPNTDSVVATFALTAPQWVPSTGFYSITTIDVSSALIDVDPGDLLVLSLYSTSTTFGGWALGDALTDGSYAGGQSFAGSPASMTANPGLDLGFRTWVDPALSVPEPASGGLAVLAFGAMLWLRRRFERRALRGAAASLVSVAALAGTVHAAPVLIADAEAKGPAGFFTSDRDEYGPGKPFAIAEVVLPDGSRAAGGGYFPGGVLTAHASSNTLDRQMNSSSTILDTLTFDLPDGMQSAQLMFTLDVKDRVATGIGALETMITLATASGGCVVPGSCASGSGSIVATINVKDGDRVVLHARAFARAQDAATTVADVYGIQGHLTLQAPAGVTFTSESGITFGAPPPPGSEPGDPIPPIPGTGDIDVGDCVFYRVRCYVDPLVAVGYEYSMAAGLSNIESFLLPADIGDGRYELYLFDTATNAYATTGIAVSGGTVYDFVDDFGITDGVSRFMIRGIEVAEAIDPTDFTRFVTGLTFMGSSLDGNLTMTPITQEVDGNGVPEPSTLVLSGLGVALLFRCRRRTRAEASRCADADRQMPRCPGASHGNSPGERAWENVYSRLRSSSRPRSQSRRIFEIRPGPIVSPACTGTTVVRPSACRRKWWLPLVRTTSKPAFLSAATSSLPAMPGRMVMPRPSPAGSR